VPRRRRARVFASWRVVASGGDVLLELAVLVGADDVVGGVDADEGLDAAALLGGGAVPQLDAGVGEEQRVDVVEASGSLRAAW
jgi:hypothetical protein